MAAGRTVRLHFTPSRGSADGPWHFLNGLFLGGGLQIVGTSSCGSLGDIGRRAGTAQRGLATHIAVVEGQSRSPVSGFQSGVNSGAVTFSFATPSLPSAYFAARRGTDASRRVNTQVNEVGRGHCKNATKPAMRGNLSCLRSVSYTAAPCSLIHSNEFCFNCFILCAH